MFRKLKLKAKFKRLSLKRYRTHFFQVFIGTDTGRVAPHMFYQACRVSGKNSTPCKERKEDGTVVIEIDLEPAKSWQVTCDCVGILKVRTSYRLKSVADLSLKPWWLRNTYRHY